MWHRVFRVFSLSELTFSSVVFVVVSDFSRLKRGNLLFAVGRRTEVPIAGAQPPTFPHPAAGADADYRRRSEALIGT